MQNQLQKAINLVNKTGDRLLVVDKSNPEQAFAIMSIDEYEKLTINRSEVRDLTENQLLDKINRDIAIWKSDNEFSENGNENSIQAQKYLSGINDKKAFLNNFDFNNNADFCEDEYNFDDEKFKTDDEEVYDKIEANFNKEEKDNDNDKKNPWAIPSVRKESAEKPIDEDTQYLEEVKY